MFRLSSSAPSPVGNPVIAPAALHGLALVVTVLLIAYVNPVVAAVKTFPVAPHADAVIEWWYVNAHVTTEKGRHLALVCAFFKFGGSDAPTLVGMPPQPTSHYLIYAVTDLDRKTQRAYSLADRAMTSGLKNLLLLTGAPDRRAKAMLRELLAGRTPSPHQIMSGAAAIEASPFSLTYGTGNSLASNNRDNTSLMLSLNGGKDKAALSLNAVKPVMPVGGTGETGLAKPTDMYYYSLTRCAVSGRIDTGDGIESIKSGQAWIDHQWGQSWTTQNDGWDWWGVQLDNGEDILLFQQRDLATGKTFFPMATFMDRDGHVTVTRRIVYLPVHGSVWKSPRSGVGYPLAWTITFPDRHLRIYIKAAIKAQEIPILSPGGDIWEGLCAVTATQTQGGYHAGTVIPGVAYMELVGYGSPVVGRMVR